MNVGYVVGVFRCTASCFGFWCSSGSRSLTFVIAALLLMFDFSTGAYSHEDGERTADGEFPIWHGILRVFLGCFALVFSSAVECVTF